MTIAYKEATADALSQAEITEKTVDEVIAISFEYILMNDVMRIIKDTNAQILRQDFDNQCSMALCIRKQEAEILRMKLEKIIGVVIEKNILMK